MPLCDRRNEISDWEDLVESLLSLEEILGVEVGKNLEILLFRSFRSNFKLFYVSSKNLASFDRFHMAYVYYKTYISDREYDHQILI